MESNIPIIGADIMRRGGKGESIIANLVHHKGAPLWGFLDQMRVLRGRTWI